MNHTTQVKRTFINTNKAWYSNAVKRPDVREEVSIHLFDGNNALIGEFSFRWDYTISGFSLHAFNDAFIALKACEDLFDHLAEHNDVNFNALAFCNILKRFGFVDSTPYVSPFAESPTSPKTCETCNGSGRYRAPYSSVIGACPDCAPAPNASNTDTIKPSTLP